jgi:hypothetical protein
MGFVIGQATTGAYSTWAKLRCPLIGDYDQFETDANLQVQPHSLTIDSGFHPDEGLFVRVSSWPGSFTWFDVNTNPHEEYYGPIVGFADGSGSSPPADSFFSIGAYDANVNAESNPAYTSANNNLDQGDIDNGFVGLTVTYTTGTLTIDADALLSYPITTPWYGQNLGVVTITAVTDIDTFTAF